MLRPGAAAEEEGQCPGPGTEGGQRGAGMGLEFPAPWLLLFTWLPAGEPWGKGAHLGPGGLGAGAARLAELAAGRAAEAWAALRRLLAAPGRQEVRDWIVSPVGTCCFPL